jgi:hypothetical protein
MRPKTTKRVVRFCVLLAVVVVGGRFVHDLERHHIPDVDQSLVPVYPGGSSLVCRSIDADAKIERDTDVVYAMEWKGQLTARFGRVRGLAGDVIGVDADGKLTVNGARLGPIAMVGEPVGLVPPETVYILAVNPMESTYPDSRKLGFIARKDVRAKILVRLGFAR